MPLIVSGTGYIRRTVSNTRPTAAEIASLVSILHEYTDMTEEDLQPALPLLTARVLDRGEYLLRAGEHAQLAGIVLHGYMREYFLLDDGTERTKAFIFAREPTGSAPDLISGEPSMTNIVAEAKSRLLLVQFSDLRRLSKLVPAWDRFTRVLLERILIRKSRREYELLALDAAGRYATLLAARPNIEQTVQARHLASYLGITPVHLSRLRRRRWAAKQANRASS
jgi:CRP-like cAMP-binding protein